MSITLQICADDLDESSIEDFTRTLVESRLLQENAAATTLGRPVTIYEPIVVAYPWGRAVAWYGHDDSGRQVSFSGTVTAHGAICLTLKSDTLSERELLAAMDDVNLRIQFDRPVLANHP